MELRKLLMLAALLTAGCGGSGEPPADQTAGAEPPLVLEDTDPSTQPQGSAVAVAPVASDSTAAPTSARFVLGRHYQRLSPTQPTSSGPDQVEVAEIFWYGCPHCFDFDAYLKQWEPSKAAYVNFVRVPAVWNPQLQIHARAFYTAEALGKGAAMHDAFFREMHERGNALDTEAKLAEFFRGFGVDPATFKTTFDSFSVHAKVQRADELSRRYKVASVPTIVVNGKYTTDGGMAGSYAALLELMNELAATERAGK